MDHETDTALEELARLWLRSERAATNRGNLGDTEGQARRASAVYESAVRSASREDLLLAWHAALKVQAACEMGSAAWAEARTVSELLRFEYLARD